MQDATYTIETRDIRLGPVWRDRRSHCAVNFYNNFSQQAIRSGRSPQSQERLSQSRRHHVGNIATIGATSAAGMLFDVMVSFTRFFLGNEMVCADGDLCC